jgi:hypothetical protein
MPDLTTIAQRLRKVRRVQSEFLARWAAESLLSRPISLDGMLGAMERKTASPRMGSRGGFEDRGGTRPGGRG